jgi:hypothetical protein
MAATDKNKPLRKDRLRLLMSGVTKHYANVTLVLAGQPYTAIALVQLIQQDIDASDLADKAHADWSQQVQIERDSHTELAPVLRALRSQVFAQFGDSKDASSTLKDFGYTPRKVTKPRVQTKADAAKKGRATRSARHTAGKNQKKDVKGTVPAETPVAAPTSPAPAPAVAAPAKPGA